jgi:hypothetical protein
MRVEAPRRTLDDLAPVRAELMREIRTGAGAKARPGRTGRVPRWTAVAGVAAAAVVIAVSAGTAMTGDHRPPVSTGHKAPAATGHKVSAAGGAGHTVPVRLLSVNEVLDNAARAALTQSDPAPADGDYVEVRSETTFESTSVSKEGTSSWLYRASRNVYLSVDGTKQGWLDETILSPMPLGTLPIPQFAYQAGPHDQWAPLGTQGADASMNQPTYTFLETLPTDPDALLGYIYAHESGGLSKNDEAWTEIGDSLREYLVPPKLRAALFEAAAKIPGVSVVQNVTDAAGRTGIAVSKVVGPDRFELIFNPQTYKYMGERDVTVTAKPGVPAGTVTGSTAILSIGVVAAIPPHNWTPSPKGNG